MKTNIINRIILADALLLMTVILSSCNSGEEMSNKSSPAVPAIVEAVYSGTTRGISNQTLNSFSLYCFDEWNEETGEMIAKNILYTLNPTTKVWSGSRAFYMSDWDAMYGYGVSPSTSDMTDVVFKQAEQGFTYTDPTSKGALVKIGSKILFTKEGTKNRLILTFNDALYTLRVQALSGFQNVRVEVKEITLHNIPNQARFTFNKKVESAGSWALTANNQYVNSTQTLPSAAVMSTTEFVDITTEQYVLFPLKPKEWDFWGDETLASAQARNCCYIEVKMRIIEEKDGQTYYLWGYADGDSRGAFESAFYPYEQYNCSAEWKMRYNGYYYLFLDDNCVDKNGNKLTPHPEEGGSNEFTVSSQIDFRTWIQNHGGTADEWTDDENQGNVNISI